jgi:hypothetical protein
MEHKLGTLPHISQPYLQQCRNIALSILTLKMFDIFQIYTESNFSPNFNYYKKKLLSKFLNYLPTLDLFPKENQQI